MMTFCFVHSPGSSVEEDTGHFPDTNSIWAHNQSEPPSYEEFRQTQGHDFSQGEHSLLPYKQTNPEEAEDIAQLVQCLPRMQEALGLTTSIK